MSLSDIVDVQIDRQSAAVSRVGFGTLLFIFNVASGSEPSARVTSYASLDEVAVDYADTDPAYLAAQAAFSGDLTPEQIKIGYKLDVGETWPEAIQACQDADPDWYALACNTATQADIEAIAADVEARSKLYTAKTADAAVLDDQDDTDVASTLLSNEYSRTAIIYHSDAASAYPDCAWAGGQLPEDPGSVTWAFKSLPGIPGETFSGSDITALEAKRCTRYETVGGLSRTIGGYTSDPGAFIDVIRGLDWLEQRMAEDVFNRLANAKKVPYTNAGIAIIEGEARNRLQIGIANGVVADDENLTVTTPQVSDTTSGDRSARILRNVSFTARLAGAIHQVIVRGTVTV